MARNTLKDNVTVKVSGMHVRLQFRERSLKAMKK